MPTSRGDIVMRLSTDEADAVRGWRRLATEGPKGFYDEIQRLGRTIEKQSDKTRSSIQNITKEIERTALAYVGVRQTIAVINEALREQNELQDRSTETALRFAAAQQRATTMLPTTSKYDMPTLTRMLEERGRGVLGFSITKAMEQMGAALSAKASLTEEQVLDTLVSVQRLTPMESVDTQEKIISGALTLQKQFGTQVKSADQAVSSMMAMLTQARQQDAGKFAQNVVPFIGMFAEASRDYKESLREAAAIPLAIAQRMEDVKGEVSMTVFSQAIKQLLPVMKGAGIDTDRQSLLATFEQFSTSRDPMIKGLRDKALGAFSKDFVAAGGVMGEDPRGKPGFSAEAKGFFALMELMGDPQASTWQEVRRLLKEQIEFSDETVKAMQESQKRTMEGDPRQLALLSQLRARELAERARLRDTGGQVVGAFRTGDEFGSMDELIRRGGFVNWLNMKMMGPVDAMSPSLGIRFRRQILKDELLEERAKAAAGVTGADERVQEISEALNALSIALKQLKEIKITGPNKEKAVASPATPQAVAP